MSIAFFYNCFHWVVSAENRACWTINEEPEPIKVGSCYCRKLIYSFNLHTQCSPRNRCRGDELSTSPQCLSSGCVIWTLYYENNKTEAWPQSPTGKFRIAKYALINGLPSLPDRGTREGYCQSSKSSKKNVSQSQCLTPFALSYRYSVTKQFLLKNSTSRLQPYRANKSTLHTQFMTIELWTHFMRAWRGICMYF